ncbi:MAG TPA: hypothetical protein VK425_01445, partial [Acidimicrobiales bacterium]|nr:hypothetical protein [Acidimicrobiales bacterium]
DREYRSATALHRLVSHLLAGRGWLSPTLRQAPSSEFSLSSPVQPGFSLVGEPLALVSNGVALVSDSVSFIGYPIALRCFGLTLNSGSLAFICLTALVGLRSFFSRFGPFDGGLGAGVLCAGTFHLSLGTRNRRLGALPLDSGLGAGETCLGAFGPSQGSVISRLGAEAGLFGPSLRGLRSGPGGLLL